MAKIKDIEYIDNSIKVKLLKQPMWMHPKCDGSEDLEYLIDYYFFDPEGAMIAHAIYNYYDKKECDEFVYDWDANFNADLFDTREEAAVPIEDEQITKILEYTKGCDRFTLFRIIDQYNEDKRQEDKFELNNFGYRTKMWRYETIAEHFIFLREFLLGRK